jgi:ATP-dependent DNA helicase RecQ
VEEAAGIPYDEALFDELRRWRLERARAEKVAPFMIAHDSALQELARRKPATPQKLLATKGFGPAKAEKYGTDILEIITQQSGEAPADGWTPTKDAELKKLIQTGTPLSALAEHFGLSAEEIWPHVAELVT